MNRTFNLSFGLFLLFSVAAFCWLGGVAAENHWMVRAFDSDESGSIIYIARMYFENFLEPISYNYGTAHTYISLLFVYALGLVKDVYTKDIVYIARGVNFVSLCASVYLLVRFGNVRKYGKWALLFAVTMIFTHLNTKYALNAKPEHFQVFFVVCSILCFQKHISEPGPKWLLLAGFFSGCAFATKYLGLLLIAFLVASLVVWAYFESSEKIGAKAFGFLKKSITLSCGFAAGTLMLGPYLIINYRKTTETLEMVSVWTRKGFNFYSEVSIFDWLSLFLGPGIFWYVFLFLAVPGLVVCFGHVKCQLDIKYVLSNYLGVAWGVFYLVYVAMFSNVLAGRYLVAVLPFAFDAVFASFGNFDEFLLKRNDRLRSAGLSVVVVAVICFTSWWSYANFIKDFVARANAPRIVAGEWMLEHIDYSKKIAHDLYTYVPNDFTNRYYDNILSFNKVAGYMPDYIVISKAISDRFQDIVNSKNYVSGQERFIDHYSLYHNLELNRLPRYELLKDYNEVKIYKKLF